MNVDCKTLSGIEARVCEDIAERQQKGIAKYGLTVAENPLPLKEWLQHAYEETLDNAIYLKRAIAEMDAKLWCAMCGEWGDHQSGTCWQLHPRNKSSEDDKTEEN